MLVAGSQGARLARNCTTPPLLSRLRRVARKAARVAEATAAAHSFSAELLASRKKAVPARFRESQSSRPHRAGHLSASCAAFLLLRSALRCPPYNLGSSGSTIQLQAASDGPAHLACSRRAPRAFVRLEKSRISLSLRGGEQPQVPIPPRGATAALQIPSLSLARDGGSARWDREKEPNDFHPEHSGVRLGSDLEG